MTSVLIQNNHRNQTADLLKGMAVIFMVQVHIMELFARQDIYNSIIGKVSLFLGGPPCAPVFMAVMGYFLFSKNKTFSYYLKRGLILFFGGIALNIGLNAHLLANYFQGRTDIDPLVYIFGADILPLAGLSALLIGLLCFIFKEKFFLYLILAIVIVFFTPIIPGFAESGSGLSYVNAFLWGDFNWSYFPLFPWFAYILTGYAFRIVFEKYKMMQKFSVSHSIVFIIPLVVVIVLTINYATGVAHDLKGDNGYYHHGILFYTWTLLFMIAYVMLAHITEEYSSDNVAIKFLKWTGRNVTAFYVIQWLIIGNIATAVYKSQGNKNLVIWFVGIIAATSVFVVMYNSFVKVFKKNISKGGLNETKV